MSHRYHTKASGSGSTLEIEVEPLGLERFAVRVAGQRREVELGGTEVGDLSLLIDGMSYPVGFQRREEVLEVSLNQQVVAVRVWDELQFRIQAAAPSGGLEGRQKLRAPMPGKVTRVLVKRGDRVEEGQGLVVVEAMKMENQLRSPKSGVIVELTAVEGTAVEAQTLLAVVE